MRSTKKKSASGKVDAGFPIRSARKRSDSGKVGTGFPIRSTKKKECFRKSGTRFSDQKRGDKSASDAKRGHNENEGEQAFCTSGKQNGREPTP